MKIRSGFVSNSSSSSFVVLGALFDQEGWSEQKLLEKYIDQEVLDEATKSSYAEADVWSDLSEDDVGEVVYELHNQDICVMTNTDDGAPENKFVVGIKLADGEEDFCGQKIKLSDVVDRLEDMGIPMDTLQIITGTRMC